MDVEDGTPLLTQRLAEDADDELAEFAGARPCKETCRNQQLGVLQTVLCSAADQQKCQSCASLVLCSHSAFVLIDTFQLLPVMSCSTAVVALSLLSGST
jgi:hypothetical protein